MKNPNQKIIDSGLLPDVSKMEDKLSELLDRTVPQIIAPDKYKGIVGLVDCSVSFTPNEKRVVIYDICKGRLSKYQLKNLENILLREITHFKALAEKEEQDLKNLINLIC